MYPIKSRCSGEDKYFLPCQQPIPPSILINVQGDATNAVYILLQYHSTCFRCRPHPSSGVYKTVVTATGTSSCSYLIPTWPS